MTETKRTITFIGLILFTVLLIAAAAVGLYLIPYVGLKNIHPLAPQIVLVTIGAIVALLVTGVVLLLITLARGKEILFAAKLRGIVIKILFPVMVIVGKVVGLSRDTVQQSFVEVNNRLVKAKFSDRKAKRILLLMPHCLQFNECDIKITSDASKCRLCGKCSICDLVKLSEKYDVELTIATGGTLARRRIMEVRPQAVIAVACERDLTSGIQDAYPLPVIGILNDRPFGPCFNTSVDGDKVDDALRFFTQGAA